MLFLKDGGRFVGASGLRKLDGEHKQAEIGYWRHRDWQGQGLIGEAVDAICAFAGRELGLRRIACLPDALNLDSRRVAERAGFQLEGILRRERIAPDGTPRDTALYARLPD